MSTEPGHMQVTPQYDFQMIHREWGWFLALGVLLIVLGIAAIVFPVAASYTITALIGVLLVIAGVAHGIHSIVSHHWRGFLLEIILAVVYLVAGVLLLAYPLGGVLTLTLLLGVFLVVAGAARIIVSLMSRTSPSWGWLLVSGILALILGTLIWVQWPSSADWVIGLLVGIDLLFSGWTMTLVALSARAINHIRPAA